MIGISQPTIGRVSTPGTKELRVRQIHTGSEHYPLPLYILLTILAVLTFTLYATDSSTTVSLTGSWTVATGFPLRTCRSVDQTNYSPSYASWIAVSASSSRVVRSRYTRSLMWT